MATLDIFTKYLIRINNIQEYVVIEDILTIDLTYNTGIAFGLLSDYTIFTYILSIFVFIWLVFQIRDIREQNLEKLSLILILAGAVGNLGERGWNLITDNDGKVTDFVELLFIPSFNLADTYISIGIALLLYSEIRKDYYWNSFWNRFVCYFKQAPWFTGTSTDSSDEYTLRDFLIENFNISEVGEYKREGIVHRLDRVTSGLIVCPIKDVFNQLQEDFKKEKLKSIKQLFKVPKSKSGEINLPLIHSQNNRREKLERMEEKQLQNTTLSQRQIPILC